MEENKATDTTITITNRDVRIALNALERVVRDRGMPDHRTALRIGKTIRQLRDSKEETDQAYDILLRNHAKRDEEGEIIEGNQPGSTKVEDPIEFAAEQRKIDKETCEVKVFPVPCSKLNTQKPKGRCAKCKQITGMPEPEAYAVLVDSGIFLDDVADEPE